MNTLEDRVRRILGMAYESAGRDHPRARSHLIAGNADFPPPNRPSLYRSGGGTR
ncbi:MAG: hypothetical protein IPK19_22135 [Chloroflexi bacterium]|nr:hypothetical protein [Chloroflexota bacterium]